MVNDVVPALVATPVIVTAPIMTSQSRLLKMNGSPFRAVMVMVAGSPNESQSISPVAYRKIVSGEPA